LGVTLSHQLFLISPQVLFKEMRTAFTPEQIFSESGLCASIGGNVFFCRRPRFGWEEWILPIQCGLPALFSRCYRRFHRQTYDF
jgi:hypothetical protein